jgi:hypothetical protein
MLTSARPLLPSAIFLLAFTASATAQVSPSLHLETTLRNGVTLEEITRNLAGIVAPLVSTDQTAYAFRNQNHDLTGSANVMVWAEADYGELHELTMASAIATSPASVAAASGAFAEFYDNVYISGTAGQAIGTPVMLNLYRVIDGGLSASGSVGTEGFATFDSYFYVQSTQVDEYGETLNSSGVTSISERNSQFKAFVGQTVTIHGQLSAGASVNTQSQFPASVVAETNINNTLHYYLSGPGVSVIGASGHDYAPLAAVPEPGFVALLVGIGIGGASFLVRRNKAQQGAKNAL